MDALPDFSDVFVDVEKLVGMIDHIFDSVNCEDNFALSLTFENFFVWDLLDDFFIVLAFLGVEMVEKFLVESELFKWDELIVEGNKALYLILSNATRVLNDNGCQAYRLIN